MAAEILNLRRARKAKAKTEKEKAAEASRIKHGTPKGGARSFQGAFGIERAAAGKQPAG
jgi:hypothetical protein